MAYATSAYAQSQSDTHLHIDAQANARCTCYPTSVLINASPLASKDWHAKDNIS